MKQNNPFAKLGALDQQLYQETTVKAAENKKHNIKSYIDNKGGEENWRKGISEINEHNDARKQESQNSGIPEIQHSSNPVLQNSGKLEIQHQLTPTEKVTYRFHPQAKYAIEDIKTILARKLGIKVSYELIAEEAILIAYEDLLENQNASKLVKRLSRMPENKKSS